MPDSFKIVHLPKKRVMCLPALYRYISYTRMKHVCVFAAWPFCLRMLLVRVCVCSSGSQEGFGGISNSHSTIDDLPDMTDLSLCGLSWLQRMLKSSLYSHRLMLIYSKLAMQNRWRDIKESAICHGTWIKVLISWNADALSGAIA